MTSEKLLSLKFRLMRKRIRNKKVAAFAERSESAVSNVLNGKKRSAYIIKKTEELLRITISHPTE